MINTENWFSQGGQSYADYRPSYPQQLAQYLSTLVTAHELAVDVGCGNGQLSQLLAHHFNRVTAFDSSADQLKYIKAAANISYGCARAEALPLADNCASLITVAQAVHWFDLPAFYQEVKRVASDNAVLALISYGVLHLDTDLNDCFEDFYYKQIYSYWPPARKLVDTAYATIDFPFIELPPPSLTIELDWQLHEFLGYISTWSAIRRASATGQTAVLHNFATRLAKLWGPPSNKRKIVWPLNMRIGRVCR